MLAAVTSAAVASTAPRPARPLAVVSFNVLAPIWAAPKWYPDEVDPALLETAFRRARISALLQRLSAETDVFCLQEVQSSELAAFLQALGPGFDGAMSVNAPDWWSSYLVPEVPWQPNGTAVIARRSSLATASMRDIALGDDGNHALLWEGTRRGSGSRLRVRVDPSRQRPEREPREGGPLAPRAAAAPRGTTDVVCGDVNEDTVVGPVGGVLARDGFADVLASLGNREATHPWSTTYNGSPKWAIIDHVLQRGGSSLAGDVLDFGVWSIPDEVSRIEANLRNTGSDHFPVVASVGLAAPA